ncbi:hypothetical protein [uncultured Winogradskyella sp.]|uniref:hypothetical protein n=1 Tax=uncultured Winogradskyella sp. TaxID=395353 RepID=UPI00260C89CF|nr:hypothetical protein [uncultured Winogradskyella sp.]
MTYKEIKNKLDNSDFVFYYHYFYGFSEKMCEYTFFINSNFNFDLILKFYEKPIDFSKELSNDIRDYRRQLYLNCKTPEVIRHRLKYILDNSFELKDSYLKKSEIGKYSSSDAVEKSSYINHKNGKFSINLGDGFDRNLIITNAEIDFMELVKIVHKWIDEISDDLMKYYGYTK